MCWNNDTNKITQSLISGAMSFSSLNYARKSHFEGAMAALNKEPRLAKKLNPQNKDEKDLILTWMARPVNTDGMFTPIRRAKIAYLDAEKVLSDESHDNDIIAAHLRQVIKTVGGREESVYQSFQNDTIVRFNFETKEGEEIVYQDRKLDIPVRLLAKLSLYVKITDPYVFVKYLDVNVEQINIESLLVKVLPLITSELRTATLKCIDDKKICYYELSKYYAAIEKDLQKSLQTALSASGLEVGNIYICQTRFSNGADYIFERQTIEFMQKEKEMELQHKEELMSLENYEKKAEIHKKYPDYEFCLTEVEKDNAIKRYRLKNGNIQENGYEKAIKHSVGERKSDIGKMKAFEQIEERRADGDLSPLWKKIRIVAILGAVILMALVCVLPFVNRAYRWYYHKFWFLCISLCVWVATFISAYIVDRKQAQNSGEISNAISKQAIIIMAVGCLIALLLLIF